MKDYLLKLLDYNFWASERIITTMEKQEHSSEYALKLMSHIVAVHYIWYERVKHKKFGFSAWDMFALDRIRAYNEKASHLWKSFVEQCTDEGLLEKYDYTNLKGEACTSQYMDTIIHLVNHSSYHRGQITMMLKSQGVQIPITDYIFYCQ